MTHSLHRRGAVEDLQEDFVMLFLLSRINPQGTFETMRQIWEVLSRHEHELVNFGTPDPDREGPQLHNMERLRKTADSRMIMAVFRNRETLASCLKEIKERDFGMSLVVSGLCQETGKVCAEAGSLASYRQSFTGHSRKYQEIARGKGSRNSYPVWARHGFFETDPSYGHGDQKGEKNLRGGCKRALQDV